jgi:hypothetical protein
MRARAAAVILCACQWLNADGSWQWKIGMDSSAIHHSISHQPSAIDSVPRTPVVVELFTSEGCSDCPPADAVLARLVADQPIAGAEVIALGEHVDYWDQLGWKDRFSSAALTNRQQTYGSHFNLDSVYTPQMVVDGRAQLVGSDAGAARRAVERAAAAGHASATLHIDAQSDRAIAVTVNVAGVPRPGRGDRAEVELAITEDAVVTEVKRGENHGRTLTHAAVVRSMTTIGQVAVDGTAAAHAEIPLGADWRRDRLKAVAFVQEQRGRAILASAVAPLQAAPR